MTDKQTINRRQFLSKLTSTVGGSVALAAASSSLVQAQPIETPSLEKQTTPSSSKGYQRTKHIDTYYQLADF